MYNYLLSIDPSMKNSGFTLWENKKPILINSFSFKKYNNDNWEEFKYKILKYQSLVPNLLVIIERGIFNPKFGRGKETLDHLRGFIAGQFNKILTKDMLVSPSEWKKWYVKIFAYAKDKKWNKEISIYLANNLIKSQDWNITINNHDQAESLLIGWYYLNKEVK